MNLAALKIALTTGVLAFATEVVGVMVVEDLMMSSIVTSAAGGLGIVFLLSSLVFIWTLKHSDLHHKMSNIDKSKLKPLNEV